jgi:hypothetical protein
MRRRLFGCDFFVGAYSKKNEPWNISKNGGKTLDFLISL